MSVCRGGSHLGVLLASALVAFGCTRLDREIVSTESSADPLMNAGSSEPIQPITLATNLDPGKVALGRRLFLDVRFSRDATMSCATCHDLARSGVDGRRVAVGLGGAKGRRNTPTVFNSDLNEKQFWDGRADTLEAQIDGPLLDEREMGGSWPNVLRVLRGDDVYSRAFVRLYGKQPVREDVRDALATYERTLRTPGSRFDRYLEGDQAALSLAEREGYEAFQNYGCVSCHQGRNVGGNMFQKLGVVRDFVEEEDDVEDLGRFQVTHREIDRNVFRVPSLRLVSRTAPYFHDGRIPTLQDAIVLMGRYQLGREIPSVDVERIASFLGSLAGECTTEGPHASR